jgi:hypothetical protein
MTVEEAIEKLKKFPSDAILISSDFGVTRRNVMIEWYPDDGESQNEVIVW